MNTVTIENDCCPLCGREILDPSDPASRVNRHHLIPKSRKGKIQYLIHEVCHQKIHATFTIRELEDIYHEWEELKAHPEIEKFVKWVKKKPPNFYDHSNNSKRKR